MKKTAWLMLSSLIGSILILAVLFGLHDRSRADGSTWIGSEIVASEETVDVEKPVTFTVSVVNNMTSTASNVLILNPVPEDTQFITVTAQDAQAMILMGSTPDFSEHDQVASAMRVAGLDETRSDRQASSAISPEDVAAVAWVGDVPTGTFVFTLTLRVDGGHRITETASIYYDGHLDVVLTKTVDVAWLEVHIPLVMSDYQPVVNWWAEYPLCPGEEMDRQGYDDPGGNDRRRRLTGPSIPVPYACVGWIHWDREYYEPGEPPDRDYYNFAASVEAPVVVTLTRLTRDYWLAGFLWHGTILQPEEINSQNPGTQDEVLVIPHAVPATQTLKVAPQGTAAYDPIEPYLLIIATQEVQ